MYDIILDKAMSLAATQKVTATAVDPEAAAAAASSALAECKDIYLDIAKMFPTDLGKSLSRTERDANGLKQPTLVYGEVTFDTLGMLSPPINKC